MGQRNQFRFDSFQINPVGLRLSAPGRAPLLGEPMVILPEGVRARFSGHQDLGIALGEKVDLQFASRGWRASIEVVGQLHTRHEQDSIRELGFTFVNRKQVEEDLLPRLRSLLNRRGATRASPDPKQPIEIRLGEAVSGRTVAGLLVDLSSTGLLVQLPLGSEAGFVNAKDCRASFRLPGDEGPGLSLIACIRERRLCSSALRLGLEFDIARTSNFPSQRDKILEYVMSRQPRTTHRVRAG
jgi:hypothetical protein